MTMGAGFDAAFAKAMLEDHKDVSEVESARDARTRSSVRC